MLFGLLAQHPVAERSRIRVVTGDFNARVRYGFATQAANQIIVLLLQRNHTAYPLLLISREALTADGFTGRS